MHKVHSCEDKEVVDGQIESNVRRTMHAVASVVCNILNGGLALREYMPHIPAPRPAASPRNSTDKSLG